MTKRRSFDQLMTEITELTTKLEDGQTDLEESLILFRRAQQLTAEARRRLEAVEHEFQVIKARFDQPTLPTGGVE